MACKRVKPTILVRICHDRNTSKGLLGKNDFKFCIIDEESLRLISCKFYCPSEFQIRMVVSVLIINTLLIRNTRHDDITQELLPQYWQY